MTDLLPQLLPGQLSAMPRASDLSLKGHSMKETPFWPPSMSPTHSNASRSTSRTSADWLHPCAQSTLFIHLSFKCLNMFFHLSVHPPFF